MLPYTKTKYIYYIDDVMYEWKQNK